MAMSPLRARNGANRAVCLKLPTDLVDRLNALAEQESRSLSGQVAHILKGYFREVDNAGNDAG